jgi:hypothetical protein
MVEIYLQYGYYDVTRGQYSHPYISEFRACDVHEPVLYFGLSSRVSFLLYKIRVAVELGSVYSVVCSSGCLLRTKRRGHIALCMNIVGRDTELAHH